MNCNKKIVMVRSDAVNPDSRLEKEAVSLVNNGYEVSILAWDRDGNLPTIENKKGYSISRIHLRAPYGKRAILSLPIWFIREFTRLLRYRVDVIHVVDFETYIPALLVAKIKKEKIVYDIFDFNADGISSPRILGIILGKIDIFLMRFANKIIIVDKCRYKQINKNPNDKQVSVIYNAPPDSLKSSLNSKNNTIRIIYAGYMSPDRDIKSMINVVKIMPDVSLVIAGIGDRDIINNIMECCNRFSNITYLGTIPYHEVLSYSQEADVLFALYDPSVPNNKVASPNKLFEAMMLGKPIIVNEGTAATDKVREENCGLVVPYGDVDALRDAVLKLKNNPQLRKELGENGRRAYETKYSWTIMEKRLLDLYKSLESEQYK